ncbi:hypothetical protein CRUP_024801, partial [Coryphaenoides rupestris]
MPSGTEDELPKDQLRRALPPQVRCPVFWKPGLQVPYSCTDTKLNGCRSNRTQCGDGDEAHCVTNATDSFCSCKPGFQKTGHRTCGDTNECLQFGVCSHICNNTKGSYKCSCYKHFTRIHDSCKADNMNSSQQILYIADDNEIRSLDPGVPNWRYEQTFQGDASVRIDAMDVHVKTNRIFWTNWHQGQISSYQLPGPPTSASSGSASGSASNSHRHRRQSEGRVSNLQLKMPRGIAVDWVAGNLYWTDSGPRRHRGRADVRTETARPSSLALIDEPYAIVVDPQRGTMYWADWGNHPKIETAAMDGTLRQTLVHEHIQWPTGLAVDYFNERLYWADAKAVPSLAASAWTDPTPIIAASGLKNKLLHPFSIDVFEDYVYGVTTMYWADWGNHPKIETAAMDGTLRQTLVHEHIQWPTGLAVDYFNERLYWADAKLSVIGSVRLDGSDPIIAASGLKNKLLHPFSIDVFEDYVYGVTYVNNIVFRVNKFGKGPVENLTTGINHATDIVLHHRYKQPETPPAGTCTLQCQNGGSCFLNARLQAKCRCQPSYRGDRCEVNHCTDYCRNGGTCTASHT